MRLIQELGGFAESLEEIEEETIEAFNAFNYCLAEDYVTALYHEDFGIIGEVTSSLLEKICKWYNYDETFENQDTVSKIRTGEFITVKNRTLINAIYEKKVSSLAETYLLMRIYSPKLVLTIILSDEEEYQAYILCDTQEEFDDKIKQLYDFIELEYSRCTNKKEFLNKIKNNYQRIMVKKSLGFKSVPDTYKWGKALRKRCINKNN